MTDTDQSGNGSSRWFAGALVLAAAIRLYLLWQYYCISSDGVVYLRTARDFFAGDLKAALGSVYPPGYPLMAAALYPVIGNWEFTGQIISFVCGVALLFPLYWIFRESFNFKVALLSCFLAAISPYLALYSAHVRTESRYLFLSTIALHLCLTGMLRDSRTRFFCGGLAAGYAYLVRPEAVGLLAVVPAIAVLRWLLWRDTGFSRMVQSMGLLCAGFALLALPYIVYLSIDTGQFGALSRKAGITLAINLKKAGVLESTDIPEGGDVQSLNFTDYIRRHPLRYAMNVVSDLPSAVGVFFEALHYSYIPFLLLGLMLYSGDKFWHKSDLLLLGFVLFYVFGFALIYVKRRYSLQAVPISLAWVALGMWYVWAKLGTWFSPNKARFVGICIALLFIGATLPKTLKPVSREKAYVREAGWYLKALNKSGRLKVAVLDDRVTFYAEAQTIPLTGIGQFDLDARLREQKADFLAAESKAFQKAFPEISKTPERYGLILEKTFFGTRSDRMLLFKIT